MDFVGCTQLPCIVDGAEGRFQGITSIYISSKNPSGIYVTDGFSARLRYSECDSHAGLRIISFLVMDLLILLPVKSLTATQKIVFNYQQITLIIHNQRNWRRQLCFRIAMNLTHSLLRRNCCCIAFMT